MRFTDSNSISNNSSSSNNNNNEHTAATRPHVQLFRVGGPDKAERASRVRRWARDTQTRTRGGRTDGRGEEPCLPDAVRDQQQWQQQQQPLRVVQSYRTPNNPNDRQPIGHPWPKDKWDTSNFDRAFTKDPVELTPVDRLFIMNLDQSEFVGFSYNNPEFVIQV
ncbi:unnamed protein product [Lampetra planeri]